MDISIKKKLNKIELDIKFFSNSKILGVIGGSGHGKSMLLKCIAGIEKPDIGSIIINSIEFYNGYKKINLPVQKRRVGYLFQGNMLFPNMNIYENIGISIPKKNKNRKDIIKDQIDRFGLNGLEKSYPNEVSGGQQQRISLARIMISNPDILLLDEPFSALDTNLKEQIQYDFKQVLQDYKGKIVLVSHDFDEIYRFCEEVIVISDGKSISFDTITNTFENPKNIKTAKIIGCSNISCFKKIEDNEIFALNWGMHVTFDKKIGNIFIGNYIFVGEGGLSLSLTKPLKNYIEVTIVHIFKNLKDVVFIVKNKQDGFDELKVTVSKEKFSHVYESSGKLYLCLDENYIKFIDD